MRVKNSILTDEMIADFLQEATEILQRLEKSLLHIAESGDVSHKLIDEAFRAFHNLKGSSGLFGYGHIGSFSHEMESYLDELRKRKKNPDSKDIDFLINAKDYIRHMLLYSENEYNETEDHEWREFDALRKLHIKSGISENILSDRTFLPDKNIVKYDIFNNSDSPVSRYSSVSVEDEKKSSREHLSSLRIDAGRLDALINQIGELVVAGVQLEQMIGNRSDSGVNESVDQMIRVVSDVRESAMRLRMVPVRTGFGRFKRLIHDLSRDLQKPIQINLEGEDSELDRTMMEQITDPMMHILRNAMDHGIETTDARRAAGKPEKGSISIRAFHFGGEIVIEIEDDGRGISRKAILEKAEDTGLIGPHCPFDGDPLELIFEPGLTTASSLSAVSGRGVGMDVVRRNIEKLRGSVDVETEEGKGSLFRLRIPLTLATIEGLHVMAGGIHSVISLDQVLECFEYNESDISSNMFRLRNEAIPCVDLADLLGIPSEKNERKYIVIVTGGGQKTGVIVDRLMGQIQSVVRPLRSVFAKAGICSGFTLLGDGGIGLILHIAGIVSSAVEKTKKNSSEYFSNEKLMLEVTGSKAAEHRLVSA